MSSRCCARSDSPPVSLPVNLTRRLRRSDSEPRLPAPCRSLGTRPSPDRESSGARSTQRPARSTWGCGPRPIPACEKRGPYADPRFRSEIRRNFECSYASQNARTGWASKAFAGVWRGRLGTLTHPRTSTPPREGLPRQKPNWRATSRIESAERRKPSYSLGVTTGTSRGPTPARPTIEGTDMHTSEMPSQSSK